MPTRNRARRRRLASNDDAAATSPQVALGNIGPAVRHGGATLAKTASAPPTPRAADHAASVRKNPRDHGAGPIDRVDRLAQFGDRGRSFLSMFAGPLPLLPSTLSSHLRPDAADRLEADWWATSLGGGGDGGGKSRGGRRGAGGGGAEHPSIALLKRSISR